MSWSGLRVPSLAYVDFSMRTIRLPGSGLWRFYTIPAPGDPGNETWSGDSWKTGGASTWFTGTFDPDLNLVYWGVGNPSPAFNGDTRQGDNLYTCSIIALDVDTGRLAWHFQFTPHDVHDWDANQIPVLVDHEINGESRKLMLSANKNGFFYVLDRESGQFLHASAFAKQSWAESIDHSGRPVVKAGVAPSKEGALVHPGGQGATTWWPPSYNPRANLFYVPIIEQAKIFVKGKSKASPSRRVLHRKHSAKYRRAISYRGTCFGSCYRRGQMGASRSTAFTADLAQVWKLGRDRHHRRGVGILGRWYFVLRDRCG